MSLIFSESSAKKQFEPASDGLHPAVVYLMVELGVQETKWGPAPHVEIGWEIADESDVINGEEKPRLVFEHYKLSKDPKSNLAKMLGSMRGKPMADGELNGFDLKRIIGTPCMVNIVQNEDSNGRIWPNVTSVVPVMKNMEKPTLSSPEAVVTFDIDLDPLSKVDDLPKWLADKIRRSPSYEKRLQKEMETSGKIEELPPEEDLESDLPFD